ncbi:interleukin-3 receptor subunit alpha isoform X20 [Mus musculus]|uniref:interleukin-3 receptor subunit alpha isoform X20 n=1 Tax=Mus musculus TaxID=10090 RepID=UPI0003D6E47A|nr:interleukin-3 receptor subunit alpha isoform X20 [Mus musculus]
MTSLPVLASSLGLNVTSCHHISVGVASGCDFTSCVTSCARLWASDFSSRPLSLPPGSVLPTTASVHTTTALMSTPLAPPLMVAMKAAPLTSTLSLAPPPTALTLSPRSPSPSTAVAALAPCPAWTTLWTCSAQSSRSEPQEYNVSIPHFWVPNAGAISFRVKSRSEVYPRKLSSWSEAWGLVCPPEVMPVKTALVTSVATVLGAGLVAAGLLLWWRKSLLYRLCPPIPRLRLPLAGEMVVWEPALEDCEVTPVTDA